jgi:hypothetical protein
MYAVNVSSPALSSGWSHDDRPFTDDVSRFTPLALLTCDALEALPVGLRLYA